MTSITQKELRSKYEYKPDFVAEVTHEPTSGTGYKRTLEYREWRNRAAAAMFDAGYTDDAVAFLKCADVPCTSIASDTQILPSNSETIWVCDTHNEHDAMLFFGTCDSRGCPDCAHRQVARFARRYVPAVLDCAKQKGRDRLRKLVLTTPLDLRDPDCKQKVRNYWNALGQLWKYLEKQNPRWNTKGTIEAFEFGPQGHKLHFHVYQFGGYLPQAAISAAWYELTGQTAYVVDVRAVAQSADATDDEIANEVLEVLKYSVKFWSLDEAGNIRYFEPNLVPNLLAVLKGTRRVRSRGIFYNIPEEPRPKLSCETCGNEMLRVGVVFFPIWQDTGFSPEEYKEFRDGNRLQSILANKSVSEGSEGNKSPPTQRPMWVGFDPCAKIGKPHYEEASNRKPF